MSNIHIKLGFIQEKRFLKSRVTPFNFTTKLKNLKAVFDWDYSDDTLEA